MNLRHPGETENSAQNNKLYVLLLEITKDQQTLWFMYDKHLTIVMTVIVK